MPIATPRTRTTVLALFLLCLSTAGAALAGSTVRTAQTAEDRSAVRLGVQMEQSRQWVKAIEHYERALKRWPDSKEIQHGLRRSKVHFGIERRYADRSFETSLITKPRRAALALFDEVLDQVRANYAESISATSFVSHGTESLYLALVNDRFAQKNLAGVEPDRIRQMRDILRNEYWNRRVADEDEARQLVARICDLAESLVRLPAGAVVMEYVFGGCNSLDDYSNFLTPDRLSDLYGNIEGEFVGLGIEIKGEAGKGMLLVNVLPDSPAAEGGMRRGEYIVSIEGRDCREMTTDEASKLLRGPEGTRVRLTVRNSSNGRAWDGSFTRRPVHVKSIPVAKIVDENLGIGYIQMTGFQKGTVDELDQALWKLRSQGMRSLIWDLRGNPGGLLTAAVEVLDRFISDGVLVSTKGRTLDQNWTYSAHRSATLVVPLVLLVDGDSASASEIVAGAVRDHRRGTIVGRQTFGKWSVQSIFPLGGSMGLRLTTAKFYSPNGHTLGKVGVRPDVVVDLPEQTTALYRPSFDVDVESDPDLKKGIEVLRRQLTRR